MLGTSISDYAHPEDVVPLLRELKGKSSGMGIVSSFSLFEGGGGLTTTTSLDPATSTSTSTAAPAPLCANAGNPYTTTASTTTSSSSVNLYPVNIVQTTPRTVDLLFRARTKSGVYVWVECKGRLHVEPGKGRKAIILTARAKLLPKLKWGTVVEAGGLVRPVPATATAAASDPALGNDGERATKRVRVCSRASTGDGVNDPGGGGGGGGGCADDHEGSSPMPMPPPPVPPPPPPRMVEREFWCMVNPSGYFVNATAGVSDVLGWKEDDLLGRSLPSLISVSNTTRGPLPPSSSSHQAYQANEEDLRQAVFNELKRVARIGVNAPLPAHQQPNAHPAVQHYFTRAPSGTFVKMRVGMHHQSGRVVDVVVVLYAPCYEFPDVDGGHCQAVLGFVAVVVVVSIVIVNVVVNVVEGKEKAVDVKGESGVGEEDEGSGGAGDEAGWWSGIIRTGAIG